MATTKKKPVAKKAPAKKPVAKKTTPAKAVTREIKITKTEELKIPVASKEKNDHVALRVIGRMITTILFMVMIPFMFVLTISLVVAMAIVFTIMLITWPFALLAKKSFKQYVVKPVSKMNKFIEMFNYNILKVLDIIFHFIIKEKFDEQVFKKNYYK